MPLWRRKVERFLETNQLRLDEVDYYAIVTEPDGDEILAGGGLQGDIIKCIAVSEQLRDAHLSNRLISHLINEAAQRGHHSVKVFTKPQNHQVFESLGFRLVGEAPLAILMENGHGMEDYKKYLQDISLSTLHSPLSTLHSSLSSLHSSLSSLHSPLSTKTGVIVMNANPFTLGHKYLIEKAAAEVDHLFKKSQASDLPPYGGGLGWGCPFRQRLRHLCRYLPHLLSEATQRCRRHADATRHRHLLPTHRTCIGSNGSLCGFRAQRCAHSPLQRAIGRTTA